MDTCAPRSVIRNLPSADMCGSAAMLLRVPLHANVASNLNEKRRFANVWGIQSRTHNEHNTAVGPDRSALGATHTCVNMGPAALSKYRVLEYSSAAPFDTRPALLSRTGRKADGKRQANLTDEFG